MIIRKQACAYEHKHGPDGDTHHNSYIGRFLGIPVVFGSKITLYDGLVRTVFLQCVEYTVKSHDYECELSEIPVIRTNINLVVLTGYAQHF